MHKFFFATPVSIFISILFSIFYGSLPLLIFGLEFFGRIYKAISLLMWLLMILIMSYNSFARRIIISQNGVRFLSLTKVYQISWDEIAEVGIADYAPSNRGGSYPFIFFSKETGNRLLLTEIKNDNTYILMRSRKKVIKAVREYWDKEIVNLNYHMKNNR